MIPFCHSAEVKVYEQMRSFKSERDLKFLEGDLCTGSLTRSCLEALSPSSSCPKRRNSPALSLGSLTQQNCFQPLRVRVSQLEAAAAPP